MDAADIAGENDFNEEILARAKANAKNFIPSPRGICLYCEAGLTGLNKTKRIYCDADCRTEYERQQLVIERTRRK